MRNKLISLDLSFKGIPEEKDMVIEYCKVNGYNFNDNGDNTLTFYFDSYAKRNAFALTAFGKCRKEHFQHTTKDLVDTVFSTNDEKEQNEAIRMLGEKSLFEFVDDITTQQVVEQYEKELEQKLRKAKEVVKSLEDSNEMVTLRYVERSIDELIAFTTRRVPEDPSDDYYDIDKYLKSVKLSIYKEYTKFNNDNLHNKIIEYCEEHDISDITKIKNVTW